MKRMMMVCVNGRRTIASDTFTRSNGAIGTAELGGAWTANAGTFEIVSNQAKATASGTNLATLQLTQTDCDVAADVTWYTGDIICIVCRAASTGNTNNMRLRADGTNIWIERTISGSNSTLATTSLSWSNGTTKHLRLSCSGNTFLGFVDGVQVLSATDDNALKSNVYVGLLAAKTSAVPASLFDNFLVMG